MDGMDGRIELSMENIYILWYCLFGDRLYRSVPIISHPFPFPFPFSYLFITMIALYLHLYLHFYFYLVFSIWKYILVYFVFARMYVRRNI